MNMEAAMYTAEEIISLYKNYGDSAYGGEKVSQLEHMLQAARLAESLGYDEEVVLAAFLHDIGHITEEAKPENEMDGYGLKNHESIGAHFLSEKGFSRKITRLVGSHVAAKRYLTYKDPIYYGQLSEASRRTLEFQGGKMSVDEADAFESDPLFDEIIQMRRWDEAAKIEHIALPHLSHFREMIIRHLSRDQQL